MTEEEVIATAFIKIEKGVTLADWSLVCEAFFDITGKNIEPPQKPKTKLEKIRELMDKKAELENPASASEQPSAKIVMPGDDDFAAEPVTVDTIKDSDDEKNPLVLKPQRAKGGTRFAKDGVTIYSVDSDKKLATKNQKEAKAANASKDKSRRDNTLKDFESEEVRFTTKPKVAPPWG